MSQKSIHVAVGVVMRHDKKVLLTKRAADAHQGNLWEFPGGKLEADEIPRVALNRELKEELGLVVDEARPLIKFHYDYVDCSVLLDVWLVNAWQGDLSGCEGKEHEWVAVSDLNTINFPAANHTIINALQLPSLYLICPGPTGNLNDYLETLETCVNAGAQFLQLRFDDSVLEKHPTLVTQVRELCDGCNAKVLLNATPTQAISQHAHGVHLSSARLLQIDSRPLDSDHWLAASCHNLNELLHAQQVGVDFVVLSPVKYTQSHQDAVPLGWDKFAQLIENITVPVYALGGMQPQDMHTAWSHGAQGLAMLSGVWEIDVPEEVIKQCFVYGS